MSSRTFLAIVAMSLACVAGTAGAASLEAYGQLPAMENVTISPDGSRIAYVTPVKGQQAVVVEALDPPALLTALKGTDQKVRALYWADPGHLLVAKSVAGYASRVISARGEWWMVQSLDVTRKQSSPLLRDYGSLSSPSHMQDNGQTMNVVDGPPQIRQVNGRTMAYLRGVAFVDGQGSPALFSVDVASGQDKITEKSLSAAWSWIVDNKGVAFVEYGYDETRKHWSLRLKENGAWTEVYSMATSIDTPDVEGISPDGSAVILDLKGDQDFEYRELSLKDGSLGPPLDRYNRFTHLINDPASHRIIGGTSSGATTEFTFFDPKDQSAWNAILQAFPGEEVDLASWSTDRSKVVVQVTGPVHGIAYILVDLKTHKATKVGDAYVGISPDDLAEVEEIQYKAADGLTIPAYLTLPNGRDPKKLPLVVLPHGGPAASDADGFDWWSQALASRGYAVLQPQFRGSDGQGWSFMSAGFGQFGRKMQSDLSDGVRALAAAGMIDPRRVCIVGGSYGGYAALAGATLDPGVYRCAVSVAGLSDLRKFLGPDEVPDLSSSLRYWDRFMGSKGPSDPVLDQISPIKHVDKITIPILLIHGKDDTVVPFEQSQIMADALIRAGKPVQFVVLPGEDHWLSRSETRLQMLQATVKFLEANNPPG